MKFAIACVAVLVSLIASGVAADERTMNSPNLANAAATKNSEPAPTLVAPAPAASTSTTGPAPEMLPAAPSAVITLKQRPQSHRFFDLTNSLALSSVAVSLSADALSTQKGLAYPSFYEMNPVARPFVKTRAGAAAYSAASFGVLAGTMYVAHKTHHHKLERILPFALAGWESLLSARNYHVIAARPR